MAELCCDETSSLKLIVAHGRHYLMHMLSMAWNLLVGVCVRWVRSTSYQAITVYKVGIASAVEVETMDWRLSTICREDLGNAISNIFVSDDSTLQTSAKKKNCRDLRQPSYQACLVAHFGITAPQFLLFPIHSFNFFPIKFWRTNLSQWILKCMQHSHSCFTTKIKIIIIRVMMTTLKTKRANTKVHWKNVRFIDNSPTNNKIL